MSLPSPSLLPLSPCTILRVRGPDRLRFLNGQLTQDVHHARDGRAVYSAILNAKGQLEAVCHVREEGADGDYLLDAPIALRETLLARLDRYLIADDVELLDESDDWHAAHLLGAEVPGNLSAWQCTRLAQPGHDLLARSPIAVEGVPELSIEQAEHARIELGIPAWGAELAEGLLPPDADLEASAISYDKGCYLGQEVISRMKRAGKTNQHLVRLAVPEGTPVPSLLVSGEKEAGRITSVSGDLALGFRRRKFAEQDEFSLRTPDGGNLPGTARVRDRAA